MTGIDYNSIYFREDFKIIKRINKSFNNISIKDIIKQLQHLLLLC